MKGKQIIATGLLALMIANFSACDSLNVLSTDNEATTTKAEDIVVTNSPILKSIDENYTNFTEYKYGNLLVGQGNPTSFLTEQGVLGKNAVNELVILDPQKTKNAEVSTRAFTDGTPNTIYLLVNYQNDRYYERDYDLNKNGYVSTWLLKYTVSKEDYQLFMKLQGDWRIRLYVREMDRLYEPEIIHQSSVTQEVLAKLSHLGGTLDNRFPNIFVANVDYDNAIVTIASIYKDGIHYFDVRVQDLGAWSLYIGQGYTEEFLLDKIKMNTIDTTVGPCLVRFGVHNSTSGPSRQKVKDGLDNTDKIAKLTQVDISTTTTKYNNKELGLS